MSNFRESLYEGTHKKSEWEEDLNYLFEEIKKLYKVEIKDKNDNTIIDDKTKKPILIDSKRRSGKPKYTHPYNVAAFLYNKEYSRKYVITALFHDVLEDTKYTEDDIRRILQNYLNRFPNVVNGNKDEFFETIINAVKCVTKQGKLSRPKAPKLKLKNKIVVEKGIEINEITFHEFFEKRQKAINIGGTLKRVSLEDLDISDLKDESKAELLNYIRKLRGYKAKMPNYINGIKESEIARIVKVADRISNLTDFSPTDDSIWLDKYIIETEEYFLDLANGTDLEQDFINAIRTATLTKNVKEYHENGDKRELRKFLE